MEILGPRANTIAKVVNGGLKKATQTPATPFGPRFMFACFDWQVFCGSSYGSKATR